MNDAIPPSPLEEIRTILTTVTQMLVDDPDGVRVELEDHPKKVLLRLHVSDGDLGKMIGASGRTARAFRTIVFGGGKKYNCVIDIYISNGNESRAAKRFA